MANNHFKIHEFSLRESLVESLSKKIVDSLADAIKTKGFATLALSGGSTPTKLLQALSNTAFAWQKVRVTLVDERWVEPSSLKSNERLIRENLLVNAAKDAEFFSLKRGEEYTKESVKAIGAALKEELGTLDVVVLGMGIDAHTASFFPEDESLMYALTTDETLCTTTASTQPKERVTLSRSFLLSCGDLFLHIEGREKKDVFFKASQSDEITTMPIIAMMQLKEPLLEVYYAE